MNSTGANGTTTLLATASHAIATATTPGKAEGTIGHLISDGTALPRTLLSELRVI
ncbi:hypothetical protein [Adhaeretor mobilis]|uniref:hypothetical protein n=1 Tax=Adhaeretor mobilis TaxID=1930276 RepID=UPI001C54D3C9|nr:hypothetical protein [Adhaeretor mobilis]